MCIQVIERYSVCKCLYYKHAVDPCPAMRQRGHQLKEKTILVGYACASHSRGRIHHPAIELPTQVLPDSGYWSIPSPSPTSIYRP
ncbi:hypothetical protein CERZMDRAFT_42825 [Cercospora zeae-maydis SCOH1-5]|uniref:Uncharacterized protein n=1 Tax=Cercospora zeae-maydis SCOH1-5 TaxID=717836 RepID=A0A6A6FE45_9PEZI|nr:hypothetical protein CERZMDRAFT_42825 [Cercospora zeae-maydis SCOH1-5]